MHLLSYTRMPKTPANVHTIRTATIYIHTSFSYNHIHHIFTLIPTKNIYTYIHIYLQKKNRITKILRQKNM